ncbi:MAG: MBL fold metallo-hydrolase [Candidatus Hodarchaeota archaeon]
MMKILILGSGQDAGIPQIGCYCENCNNARAKKEYIHLAPSLSLYDIKRGFCFLIDASPDIKYQVDSLKNKKIVGNREGVLPVDGIFLTHAHFGHCSGLWLLGKECIDEKNVPIYCSPKMKQFLKNNHPFSHLLDRKNIILKELAVSKEMHFEEFNFFIKSIEIPHRNEFADTVGYLIKSKRMLLYIPDLDFWTEEIVNLVNSVDIALIDGTFYTKNEIPSGRDILHPPITETMDLFKHSNTEIYFTHFNHSNPIVKPEGEERNNAIKKGFKIVYDGLRIDL